MPCARPSFSIYPSTYSFLGPWKYAYPNENSRVENKYKEEGRKLTYGVCVDNSDGVITCNKYVPKGEHAEFEDWGLEIDNAYKKYRFYKKIPKDDN